MQLAHSQLKPSHWCPYCEVPLLQDEVDEIELPMEQGCPGATTLYKDECCACGNEVEDYNFQDERDE